MVSVHRQVGGWPALGWPNHWEQPVGSDNRQEWNGLGISRRNSLVVRAGPLAVGPDNRVEIAPDDGVVSIHARCWRQTAPQGSNAARPNNRLP